MRWGALCLVAATACQPSSGAIDVSACGLPPGPNRSGPYEELVVFIFGPESAEPNSFLMRLRIEETDARWTLIDSSGPRVDDIIDVTEGELATTGLGRIPFVDPVGFDHVDVWCGDPFDIFASYSFALGDTYRVVPSLTEEDRMKCACGTTGNGLRLWRPGDACTMGDSGTFTRYSAPEWEATALSTAEFYLVVDGSECLPP